MAILLALQVVLLVKLVSLLRDFLVEVIFHSPGGWLIGSFLVLVLWSCDFVWDLLLFLGFLGEQFIWFLTWLLDERYRNDRFWNWFT